MLQTLLDDRYLSLSLQYQSLLLHSQYHRPNGWDYVPGGHRNLFDEATMWGIIICASWRFMCSEWQKMASIWRFSAS